jgi:hypothetical protein
MADHRPTGLPDVPKHRWRVVRHETRRGDAWSLLLEPRNFFKRTRFETPIVVGAKISKANLREAADYLYGQWAKVNDIEVNNARFEGTFPPNRIWLAEEEEVASRLAAAESLTDLPARERAKADLMREFPESYAVVIQRLSRQR